MTGNRSQEPPIVRALGARPLRDARRTEAELEGCDMTPNPGAQTERWRLGRSGWALALLLWWALDGADLIALPTNFPPGAECMAAHVANTRAMENNVYYACVNRVGSDRGFSFIGQSKICDPSGRPLAEAAHANEELLYADIDVRRARSKRIVRVPEKHIIDRFKDRRPEMYGRINAK